LIAAGLGLSTAQGGDPETAADINMPDVVAPGMFDPPSPAEMQDLATFAGSRGISIKEAVDTYGWRRGFSQLAQEIAASHPDSFAGAGIEEDGSASIAFKGAVPASATSLVQLFERMLLESGASSTRIDLVPNRGFLERG
jgi:hypothetical protein